MIEKDMKTIQRHTFTTFSVKEPDGCTAYTIVFRVSYPAIANWLKTCRHRLGELS